MCAVQKMKAGKCERNTLLIKQVQSYSNIDVKNIRKSMGMTQKQFAAVFGVSIKTVEAWEHGRNNPNGVAMRLLEVCEKRPSVFQKLGIINQI